MCALAAAGLAAQLNAPPGATIAALGGAVFAVAALGGAVFAVAALTARR
ncbi:hypothetical protein [Candidatus Solirubrobacter pratensis]|nr:hypothetical protein [Candidatus Solirubrobacter pratensis]